MASPSDQALTANHYKTYKEDTDRIAQWLAVTARSCGYPYALLTTSSERNASRPQGSDPGSLAGTPKSSGRLKGKERKKQAAAVAGGSGASQQPNGKTSAAKPTHVVARKEFVILAKYIAAATKPKVKV